jgi:galactokinase
MAGEEARVFGELYGEDGAAGAKERYRALAAGLLALEKDPPGGVDRGTEHGEGVRFFSAPGRTELAGNHTDHNNGKVLAASLRLDIAAAAARRTDTLVVFRSSGYPDVVLDLAGKDKRPALEPDPAERGTTAALIRGIAAQFAERGGTPGGFTACADSRILPGAGLSSSAALEVLIGKIFDSFYGEGAIAPLELARMGQNAENRWFGKPSGLMDQIACATGGVVAVDFRDPAAPQVSGLKFDPASLGFALCVINTGGSHADLTGDYAAISKEMKAVAAFFGKESLRDCAIGMVLEKAAELRRALGDRAVLRALHYFGENRRVDDMKLALERIEASWDFEEKRSFLGRYLGLVEESGKSSLELLQNIWSPGNSREQGIALGLALSRMILGQNGRDRVHGGGFAGTIQAYVPVHHLERYRREMEAVFGAGSLSVLDIRQRGVTELFLE